MFKLGFITALCAVFLQIMVFLQPILPKELQVSLVCETVTESLMSHQKSTSHHMMHTQNHHMQNNKKQLKKHQDHTCIYCQAFSNVTSFLSLGINEVFDRLQIKLLAFKKYYQHIYFFLQKLFLIPQGRAPPTL